MGDLTQLDYTEFISDALSRDPNSRFAASCHDFLQKKGFLSDQQIIVLKKVGHKVEEFEELDFESGGYNKKRKWDDEE